MHYRSGPVLAWPRFPSRRVVAITIAITIALAAIAPAARALDKQGAAHRNDGAAGPASPVPGLEVSGQLFFGVLPYNPSYAARPDNTGHALLRCGGHADINLLGERLFVPLDLNLFSDGDASPVRPSEVDFIGGLASAWDVPGGSAEIGARAEVDTNADGRAARLGGRQAYADVRGRYVVSLGRQLPAITSALAQGDVAGWLTLGWFAWNPTYYARPDNSGKALLRYAAHADVSFWRHRLAILADATFFTDRTANPVRPSELDLTLGASLALGPWALQVAFERDMPTDDRGVTRLVQQMVMVQGSWSFAWNATGRMP